MVELNYRDSRPIYEQIEDSFKKLIISGAMKPDEKLPSVRTLAMELSINPNTIQRAYNELESSGYLYSVPGKGNFVCPLKEADTSHITEIEQKIRELISELRYLNVPENEISNLCKL